jgi:hypothetical protein
MKAQWLPLVLLAASSLNACASTRSIPLAPRYQATSGAQQPNVSTEEGHRKMANNEQQVKRIIDEVARSTGAVVRHEPGNSVSFAVEGRAVSYMFGDRALSEEMTNAFIQEIVEELTGKS